MAKQKDKKKPAPAKPFPKMPEKAEKKEEKKMPSKKGKC